MTAESSPPWERPIELRPIAENVTYAEGVDREAVWRAAFAQMAGTKPEYIRVEFATVGCPRHPLPIVRAWVLPEAWKNRPPIALVRL